MARPSRTANHEHKSDPWPVSEASKKKSKKAPAKKASRKKLDPVEDPDAEITVALVNKRLNADRHPATARKISGVKAERLRWLLRGREFGTRPITEEDVEQRLDGIDKEYNSIKEWRKYKDLEGEIDESNVVKGKRARKKPDRLGEKQPDAFAKEKEDEQDGEGMGYHAYMRKHLKQYGGNMAKAAAAYREQKGKGSDKNMDGGHYARADGSVRSKDRGKYGHTHKPGKNPALSFEDAKEDEPERAPSPPRARITRNMSPRTKRRLEREQRGKGHGDEQDGEGFFKDIGDGIKKGWDWAKTHKAEIAENAALVAGAVFMPGVGEAIDTAVLAGEAGEAGAAAADATGAIDAGEFDDDAELLDDGPSDATLARRRAFTEGPADGRGTITMDGESAANEGASKWKPDGARSLANINNQGRTSAIKNLITGADDGATRAQAFKNIKYGVGVAAVTQADEILKDESVKPGPDGGDDDDGGDDGGDGGTGDSGGPTQQQIMQQEMERMRQQQRQAAEANAFAANAAALRHNDYINPF